MSGEYLLLKWGTLKAWQFEGNERAIAAAQRWADGGVSISCATQHNTPAQKQALCDLIDAVDGPIENDWSGEVMTKAEAKKYVLEYQ